MLSDRQRLAPITGLLWLCRHPKATNLQQFESLLALTNLASYEEGCVEAILGNQGLKCLLWLQFSEHLLVRRAATEALCNMVYHPRVLASLRNPDTLKLWLALAEDYEGDLPTARAAAGGLAMASKDEGKGRMIFFLNGKSRLHVCSQNLIHRTGQRHCESVNHGVERMANFIVEWG